MSCLLADFVGNPREREAAGQREAFWRNHSQVQYPHRILELKGGAECLVLAYFYQRASEISFRCNVQIAELEIKNISEEKLCKRTGLSPKSVYRAIDSLEKNQYIRVTRTWSALTGERRVNVYLLLHSATKEPLYSFEDEWQVCLANKELPYITAPWETRETLIPMTRSGRQVYLGALSMGSKKTEMSFAVSREEWETETRLGRTAFDRGVTECAKRGLLTYKRYVLTLNDPRTGKPSVRQPHEFTRHEDTNWKYNFNDLAAEHWRAVLADLLPRAVFNEGTDGWTHTSREVRCPFCHAERVFRVNVHRKVVDGKETPPRFNCYGCDRHGFLGQLVLWVKLYPSMRRVKKYIKGVLGEWPEKAAA